LRAILNELVEGEGFENFCDLKFTGTSALASTADSALEQIINLWITFSEVFPAEKSSRAVFIVVSTGYAKATPPDTTAQECYFR
jgi:hypothetical protein